MKNLVVVINDESKLEYDRSKSLPDLQVIYLDKMDQQMDQGIPAGPGHIFAPDQQQKAQFVANQLINAIGTDDEQLAAATMAYLANRLPDLLQVSAVEKDAEVTIKLIYDMAYSKPQTINFVKPGQLDS
jgi:hypothetical protein